MNVKGLSQKELEALAADIRKAFGDKDGGMMAIAAAVAPAIYDAIVEKEIASLLLTQHILPKGEAAKYDKVREVKAYWVAKGGQVHESNVNDEEVEFTIDRVASAPNVDISVLQNGDIYRLTDMETWAADAIRKQLNRRAISVISAAVPDTNVVTVTGGSLTADALNDAVKILDDKDLALKYIVLRGARFGDMREWTLDPITQRELLEKGVIKLYAGAGIIRNAAADLAEVLLIPDEEVGKYAIRQTIAVEPDKQPSAFKVGFVCWMEAAMGVLRPDLLAKIIITS
ncbi:MAG: hypothetical protein H8E87_01560 [FCB group bacterium]|nr:hypothetical protein [FCB group bacterium]